MEQRHVPPNQLSTAGHAEATHVDLRPREAEPCSGVDAVVGIILTLLDIGFALLCRGIRQAAAERNNHLLEQQFL